jgi:hypothetical protein
VAQIIGPAKIAPANAKGHFSENGAPEETTPHMKAHIGANQVMGLNNSNTALGAGRWDRTKGAAVSFIGRAYVGHFKVSIKIDTI